MLSSSPLPSFLPPANQTKNNGAGFRIGNRGAQVVLEKGAGRPRKGNEWRRFGPNKDGESFEIHFFF